MTFLEWEGIEDDFDEDFLFDCFDEELCDEKYKKTCILHNFYVYIPPILEKGSFQRKSSSMEEKYNVRVLYHYYY